MFTRSSAKAERDRSKTIERERCVERKRKLFIREPYTASYSLRSTMGRRRGSLNQASSSRAKRIDDNEFTPIQLFALQEEDHSMEDSQNEVSK